ncbi:MAM and LDL-receptor class A domain-containing 1-like [Paramuricea clavata]|uniref:MAM and LDL-receptor class A domain-containing 1-like n=3 Tax=Paramuricea clavata TaxID=317549 RepID=A0A6S7J7I0_PARCT|nr:MAM and LDL-receptor class A domain-containing 1-like [Paramuricea clavata]
MKFSYHMYGGGIGALNIYANNQSIFSRSGNQGNRWISEETSILEGGRYMVEFEGVRGRSYEGDIAIDAISFTPGSCPFQTPKPPTPRPTNPPTSSTNPPTQAANCNFDNGDTCGYQNGAGQFNWKVNRGSTSSSGTGPSSDVSGRGFYLFIETSSPRQFGDKATILTSYLNGPQCMKFSYHMYGGGIGALNIYANNQSIFSRSGNQGNRWISEETSILQGGRYMVTFEGVRGRSYEGDIAIDEISFTPGSCSANCNFDNGDTCGYQNGAGQFNWKVNRGSTPSSGTGPSSDVSGRGFYLFIETSSPRQFGDKATILTSYLNGPQCMKFSYHMYGGGIGALNIYANNQSIFSRSGNQGNRWISEETSILQGGRYMVEFEGVRGRSYEGDIAIDAISFTPGSCPFQTPKPPTPRPTNPPTSSTNPPTQAGTVVVYHFYNFLVNTTKSLYTNDDHMPGLWSTALSASKVWILTYCDVQYLLLGTCLEFGFWREFLLNVITQGVGSNSPHQEANDKCARQLMPNGLVFDEEEK